ncbi:MFS transporter [Paenibacillaceae bacterium]|nr:MFS transporter [Paenibacillaceae bacterium]
MATTTLIPEKTGVPESSQAVAHQIEDTAAIATNRSDHVIFIAVTLMYWATLYVYVPILTPYLEFRGLSMQLIGFVLGSYGLTQIIVRFPLGIASDKLRRRKPFIMLGMITGALSCLLFIVPGSWVWPLLGRVMSGVCASTWVAFTVLYASYFKTSGATKAMGAISFITVSGQLIGMSVSGWLAERFHWNTAFFTGVAFGIAGLVLAFAVKEPRQGVERAPISLAKLGEVVRTRVLIRVSILSIFAHCILFITMFGFTPLQATALGASKWELTYVVIAFMVPHAITCLFSAKWFVPLIGEWKLMTIGFILSGLFTAAIAFSPSLPWLMVTQACNGLVQGLYFPLLLGMAIRDFETSKRATAMGFYQAIYSVGMFAGPFLAGWLNGSFGLQSGFYLGAVIALIGALFVTLSKRDFAS